MLPKRNLLGEFYASAILFLAPGWELVLSRSRPSPNLPLRFRQRCGRSSSAGRRGAGAAGPRRVVEVARLWADELARQALLIALGMRMGGEILNGCPQRLLAEEDHPLQAGLLDASYESFRVGVQVGRSWR